jgi:hypothetical protein
LRAEAALLAFCVALPALGQGVATRFEKLDFEEYERQKAAKGVVLLAVNWNRSWGCGGFENAQLRSIGFDRLPLTKTTDEPPPDVLLDDAPLLLTKPGFDDYALVVEPGEYAFSTFEIKAARSVNDIGFFRGKRSVLMKGGEALAGSFKVAAGEMIYIGHFALTCSGGPAPWRYYLKDRAGLDEYLAKVKAKFRGLDAEKAQYRLFRTTKMGQDYALPP